MVRKCLRAENIEHSNGHKQHEKHCLKMLANHCKSHSWVGTPAKRWWGAVLQPKPPFAILSLENNTGLRNDSASFWSGVKPLTKKSAVCWKRRNLHPVPKVRATDGDCAADGSEGWESGAGSWWPRWQCRQPVALRRQHRVGKGLVFQKQVKKTFWNVCLEAKQEAGTCIQSDWEL